MTSARAIEYRITRNLVRRRFESAAEEPGSAARHIICILAMTVGMLLFGSLVPELLGALMAGAALAALGGRAA